MTNRLLFLRKDSKLSLRKLFEYVHIHYSILARLENEDRNLSLAAIKTLTDFYHVTSDYLLGYSRLGIYVEDSHGFELLSQDKYLQINNDKYIDIY